MPNKEMLSKNFAVSEMSCKCGCEEGKYPDPSIVILLELIRAHFGNKYSLPCVVEILGGNRCKEHNETVQKKWVPINNPGKEYIPYSSTSQHMNFIAADIRVKIRTSDEIHCSIDEPIRWSSKWVQVYPQEVYDFLDNLFPNSLGLGLYKDRNHIDARQKRARY